MTQTAKYTKGSAISDASIKTLKRHSYLSAVDGTALPTHWINEWLLHIVQRPASFLITDSDYVLTAAELSAFAAGIAKMQAGRPLAYLTGQQAFWSLEFKVNEHTLIPRPDTEVLVEQVLAWIAANIDWAKSTAVKKNSLSNDLDNASPQKPYQLLDLGTGSGCIAISLAHELSLQSPVWQVTAVDYSQGALDIAKQNAILNGTPDVNFIQSDWYNALPDEVKYQVIVSNPPYIDPVDKHLEQLNAEPLSALIADNQGLADIQKIVSGAVDHLLAGGLLAIEHGYDQGDAVQAIFTEAGFVKVQTIKDYGGNDRVTMGALAGLK